MLRQFFLFFNFFKVSFVETSIGCRVEGCSEKSRKASWRNTEGVHATEGPRPRSQSATPMPVLLLFGSLASAQRKRVLLPHPRSSGCPAISRVWGRAKDGFGGEPRKRRVCEARRCGQEDQRMMGKAAWWAMGRSQGF